MNHSASHGTLYGGAPPQGLSTDPLIINVCLTGNVSTREISPHLPVSVEAIIEDAAAALEAGASMLHIHARAADGSPAWQPEIYGRIFEGIRRHYPEAILVASASGRLHGTLEKRTATFDLDGSAKPDMASLTLGSLNFPAQASINAPDTIQAFCTRMRERGITPELEVFDLGMLNYGLF